MKKNRRFLGKLVSVSFTIGCLMANTVFAAAPGTLLTSEKNGDQLILYIQNPGEIEGITGQIGTTPCEDISYTPISETEVPIRTVMLVDNSLSTTEAYRPMIREMMNSLIATRIEGEQFTIATFSESISYLVQDSSDYVELKRAIDGIEYAHQNTHLTDVLYELLTEWSESEEQGYRRIVLFSDGLDNKTVGYTREELLELLEEHPYPIYTIGCADANEETGAGLENMFALSRMTEASHWLFADIADPMDVVGEIAEGNDVVRVAVTVPASVSDGTQKGVKLSIQTANGVKDVSAIMEMPFGKLTEDNNTEPEEIPAEPEEDGGIPIYVLIIAAVVVMVVGGIVAMKMQQKNEDETRFQTAPKGAAPQPENAGFDWKQNDETEPLTDIAYETGNATAIIWASNKLVLIDQKNASRRFEAPLSQPVVIGRGRDTGCTIVLDYDTSVSRRPHCQVRMVNGKAMVKDLGSSNGTYLKGQKIVSETEIVSGDILKIGKVEMKVELY